MPPRILCLDFSPDLPGQQLSLAGIRRHAKARGWGVSTFSREEVPAGAVAPLLARLRPLGCIVSDYLGNGKKPPRLFGDTPVVYLDTPGKVKWRGAMSVVCDNAAIARAAFDELAAGLPDSFAFVPSESLRPWNAERGAVFRTLCAKAGKPCHAFSGHRGESREERLARLGAWVAKLPARCAVFASNDNTACDVAAAFAAVRRAVPRENTIVGADGGETASIPVVSCASSSSAASAAPCASGARTGFSKAIKIYSQKAPLFPNDMVYHCCQLQTLF